MMKRIILLLSLVLLFLSIQMRGSDFATNNFTYANLELRNVSTKWVLQNDYITNVRIVS